MYVASPSAATRFIQCPHMPLSLVHSRSTSEIILPEMSVWITCCIGRESGSKPSLILRSQDSYGTCNLTLKQIHSNAKVVEETCGLYRMNDVRHVVSASLNPRHGANSCAKSAELPHICLYCPSNAGPGVGKNRGLSVPSKRVLTQSNQSEGGGRGTRIAVAGPDANIH